MSKKEQNKKTQEQPGKETQEQLQEQPTEQSKEQPKNSSKPAGESGDAVVAKQLMAKLGVDKIYKAGSYWFKSRDDAESWAKQQRCEVEEYGGAEK